MKTQHYLLIVFLLGFLIQGLADGVSVEIAKKVAQNIYFERASGELNLKYEDITINEAEVITSGNDTLIYIYNINDYEGFTIIAAQDNVFPVLGYSYEGSFIIPTPEIQNNFYDWFENIKSQILFATDTNLEQNTAIENDWKHYTKKEFIPSGSKGGVSPLIASKWDQGEYYNANCPATTGNTTGHCLTGCVATAMGQVMHYWSYPPKDPAGVNDYNWTNMPGQLSGLNNDVAKLLRDIGDAVFMDYGPNGSSAYPSNIKPALINSFDYPNTIEFIQKNDFEPEIWEGTIISDLEAFKPVLYGGRGTGGHRFVVDGYEGSGFPFHFHFNWGWSGNNNGYFYLNNLNPGTFNFTNSQSAVVGAEAPSYIKVIAANGGEDWLGDQTHQIKWTSNLPATENLLIELYKAGVLVYGISTSLNDKIEDWSIPDTIILGTDYKIKIISQDDTAIWGESDVEFEISSIASLEVKSPENSTVWPRGTKQLITWESNFTETVDIIILENGNPTGLEFTDQENTGTFSWNIPNGQNLSNDYTVKIFKHGENIFNDESDMFEIAGSQITITNPSAGQSWCRNNKPLFKWNANFPETVKIELFENNPPVFVQEIAASTSNDGEFMEWTVPQTLTLGNQYRIKISRNGLPAIEAMSDFFSITNVLVLYPNGGAKFGINSTHTISFQYDFPGNIIIELLQPSAPNSVVILNDNVDPSSGKYSWTINQANIITGNDKKIRITSKNDNSIKDESDAEFTIRAIEVTEPEGGVTWARGTTKNIKWVSNGFAEKVKIKWQRYDTNDNLIESVWINGGEASYDNDGNENWDIPAGQTLGSKYKIYMFKEGDLSVKDWSNYFTINDLEVTSPTTGTEIWWAGNPYNITWNDNIADPVKIQLFKGGNFYKELYGNTPSDGTETWTIPPPPVGEIPEPGSDYRIKVLSANNNGIKDISDNDFTIISNKITNPIGGELYTPGEVLTIEWKSNQPGPVDIEIYEFGILKETIYGVTNLLLPNTNEYQYIIPDSFLGTYKIKIKCSINPNTYDEREFEVVPLTAISWIGAMDDDWDNPANWDLGIIPDATFDVLIPTGIPNDPIIYGSATTNLLTVEPGTSLTISSSGNLTTYGLFTNDGDLVVLSDGDGYSGSFIDLGGIAGSGTFEFHRNIVNTAPAGDQSGWHYLSSPVSGFTSHSIMDYWLNIWEETAHSWNHIEGIGPCTPDAPVDLGALSGWSIKRDASYNCPSNPGTGEVIELTGLITSLNTGAIPQVSLTYTSGDHEGWNLLGNPYSCSIDPGQIAWSPNTDQSVYMWDGVLNNYNSWVGGVGPNIPPTQGFFVHTNAADDFSLSGNERIHDNGQYWFKSEISNLLKLEAKSDDYNRSDITYIRFLDEASTSFDSKWDAFKLMSGVPEVPQIYTATSEDILSINSMPKADRVTLFFEAGKSGTYTLEITEANDFDIVFLEDKITGAKIDLMSESYTFNFVEGDAVERFVVHFKDIPIDCDQSNMNIYSDNNNVFIMNSGNLQGEVNIFNLVGQQLTGSVLHDGRNIITLNDPKGIYLVKVKTNDIMQTKKVYIK